MKKHIVGFAVFSFIVGLTIFIYENFNAIEQKDAVSYSNKKSFSKQRGEIFEANLDSPKVAQAVLNLKEKVFYWRLATPVKDAPVMLHFFIKDENGTRFIASEQGVSSALKSKEFSFQHSWTWLGKIDSYNNLYVIAEFVSPEEFYSKNSRLKFNALNATPVSINWGY